MPEPGVPQRGEHNLSALDATKTCLRLISNHVQVPRLPSKPHRICVSQGLRLTMSRYPRTEVQAIFWGNQSRQPTHQGYAFHLMPGQSWNMTQWPEHRLCQNTSMGLDPLAYDGSDNSLYFELQHFPPPHQSHQANSRQPQDPLR